MKQFDIKIEARHIPVLEIKIEELNKAAAKVNVPPVTVEYNSDTPISLFEYGKMAYAITAIISYEDIVIDGWSVIGHIKTRNGVSSYTGSVPEPVRERELTCDHCGKPRHRVIHWVLENEEGEHMMIGSACVKQYLGINPELLLSVFDARCAVQEWKGRTEDDPAEELLEEMGMAEPFTSTSFMMPLDIFLAKVIAVINSHGWISRSMARASHGRATADRAWEAPKRKIDEKAVKQGLAEAREAIKWAAAVDAANEYEATLKNIASAGHGLLHYEHCGFAASMINAYRRATEVNASGYVGEVGEKVEVDVTVSMIKKINAYYGVQKVITLHTDSKHKLVWRTTSKIVDDWNVGDTHRIRGKVKRHNHWQGQDQTEIVRAAVV